jgi:glycosyltransferase involved in cell wall biosynthesis
MLEIPVIGQAFSTNDSPYQQNPEDRNYLLLADTLEEWQAQIEKLIADKQLRREMGRKAREYVEKEYSISNNAHKWVEAYEKLI